MYQFAAFVSLTMLSLLAQPGLAQTDDPSASVPRELLAAFTRLDNKPVIRDASSCIMLDQSTTAAMLDKAAQYDRSGNRICCERLLAAIAEHAATLPPAEKMQLLLARAEYLDSHQLYDSAAALARVAGREADAKNGWPEKTRALLVLSNGALRQRNMTAAYAWADTALQLSRREHNQWLEGRALLQMALCGRRNFTSSSQRAFPYYLQAQEKAEAAADSITLFNSDIYYANDNIEIGKWEAAVPRLKQAIDIALQTGNVYELNAAYTSAGYALLQKGHATQALVFFKKALVLSQQQRMPYSIESACFELAGAFQEARQYDSALLYAGMADSVRGIDSHWANTWLLKAGILKDMGNYKLAADMYDKAMAWSYHDFLYRNQDQLSGYDARLKTAEKELQIVEEKKHAAQLEWMITAAVALLLMAACAWFLQRRSKKKLQIQKNIIERQRLDLEKSLGEKDMLLKEIHHRVKNNLSVISSLLELQAVSLSDGKAKAAIAEGQNRIRSIALIHQRLYQHENLAAIEFGSFVRDMIQQVGDVLRRPGQEISIDLQVPETLLDIDTAVPLGLIVNELLTNSFKYAFTSAKKGLLHIGLSSPSPGHYTLVYSDNGPGMPDGFDLKKNRSLGLRLIYRLSSQLGGDAEHVLHEGTMFVIRFRDALTRNQEV